ncbi:MAG TPA: DUF4382 domain-containing protein [Candidatus Acidoferrum sp.]|nr:DUF4382 domain-containing protein [Candidatus Acidoferrum sp.]
MKRFSLGPASLLALSLLGLSSCSGPVGGPPPPPPGKANFAVTVTDAPPAGASFLSFNVPIQSVSLTSTTGSVVNVLSPASPIVLDMVRLQSDSALLGTAQIAADSYASMSIQLGVVNTVFSNTNSSAIGSCPANSVCSLNSGTPPLQTITFASPITISSNTNVGLNLDFNLNNAVTTAAGITIDFTQPNILSIPNALQTGGTLNTIEDFTGVITSVSGSNVTIASGTRGTLTGTVNSSTTYTALASSKTVCGGNPNASCLAASGTRTVSVDGTVSTSGAVTITEVDFIDDPFTDEIEGVIYPAGAAGVYNMVVADKVNATGNSLLNPVSAGAIVSVTFANGAEFDVDTRNLLTSAPSGFSSPSDIFAGQEVMLHVQSVSSGTLLNIVADRAVLRYTRVTGLFNTGSGNSFTFQQTGLPPFFGTFTSAPVVLTVTGVTLFDGGISDLSGLTNGNTVSIRALYLHNNLQFPFQAAKVRKH